MRGGALRRTGTSTVVLLTGDGAGYEAGIGFHADLERMAKRGWRIEVLAWEHACNQRLRSWAEDVGVFIPLERFYHQISFIEGGRTVLPLSLKHRPVVSDRNGEGAQS